MAENQQVTYEVLVGDGGRWITDSSHEAKSVATRQARALLKSGQHHAIRVIRERGNRAPQVVFQQEGEAAGEKPITISQIDDAAICTEFGDLVSFEARRTTGRVLRKYLDRQNLTALELLHDYGQLRVLGRTDKLFDQAIHRIASVQARNLEETAQARIDLLYRLADEATKAARDAGETGAFVKIMNEKGLPAALEAIGKATDAGTRRYVIHCALAAYIGQQRDWRDKFGLVLDLLEKPLDDAALIHLDELCAEMLDGADSIREILGTTQDIAATLNLMVQFATGQYAPAGRADPPARGADPLHDRINQVVQSHDLPVTRGILLQRVARAMSSIQPLTRESDTADRAVFLTLLKMVVAPAGLHGGVAMSDAVTRRARIVMKSGDDDLSPEDAIARVLTALPNHAVAIGYLFDLHRSEFGEKYSAAVLAEILNIVEPMNALRDLLPAKSDPDDVAAAMTDLRQRIGDDALGDEIGALIAKKFDGVLDRNGVGAPKAAAPAEAAPEPGKKGRGARKRVYSPGEVIFQEGDPGDEAFMINSGKIEISTQSGDERIVLAVLERGEFFGEMALVDDEPRMATATATQEATVSVVPQEAFKKRLAWLAEEDRMISNIVEVLMTRLRQLGSV